MTVSRSTPAKPAARAAASQQTLATIPKGPEPTTRERHVKRYIAVCPFSDASEQDTCPWNHREKPKPHATIAGAEVETIRHIRETNLHMSLLSREVMAKRTVQVTRKVIGEEIVTE